MLYTGAVALHLCVVLIMGLVVESWMLALGLALAGILTATFAAMQATLAYLVAPAGMRGRLLGLMTVCIGAGVIGSANAGLTAELFGATNALWIIAAEGALPLALIVWRWTELREPASSG